MSERDWSWARWITATAALAFISMATILASSTILFGSPRAALDFLRGDRLLVDAHEKDFGTVESGASVEVSFSIYNASDRPITLVGSRSSCSCTVAEGLPLTLKPATRGSLKVVVKGGTKVGDLAETVKLFTTSRRSSRLYLKVTGRVTDMARAERAGPTKGG